MDTSSHLTNNVKLALKIMTDYSATQIFNINSHNIEGNDITLKWWIIKIEITSWFFILGNINHNLPDIDTLIHEHGIISKINSNNDGFDYLPTYASPDEKYPAICVYLEDIAFTNWGVSGANFEPLGNKIVIFFQSHYIKYFLFNS